MKKTRIIAIANQKGGVGKTTTACNVAAGLVTAGNKVLLIDFDPQANLSEYLGFEYDGQSPTINDLMAVTAQNGTPQTMSAIRTNAEGIDYIPSSIALSGAELYMVNAFCREQILKKVLAPVVVADTYDYIIIDCLPSLGILLVNALTVSDKVIIPVQAQKFALDGLVVFLSIVDMVQSNLNRELRVDGLLLTMVDNTNMSKAVESALREQYPQIRLFDTKISKSVEAPNSTYAQKSLVSTRNSKLGEQYGSLVKEISEV